MNYKRQKIARELVIELAIIKKKKREKRRTLSYYLMLILGCFLIGGAIPLWMIYVKLNPQNPKKALQTAVFSLSMGFAIIFYLKNKKKFSSIADIVTYFTEAGVAPVTMIEFLLD